MKGITIIKYSKYVHQWLFIKLEKYKKVQIPYLNIFIMSLTKKWGNPYHILDNTKLDGAANMRGPWGFLSLVAFLQSTDNVMQFG